MTISPHFLAGAALATTTTSSVVAFLLGFLSHFILDALPHLEPGTFFSEKENHEIHWPIWVYFFAAIEFIFIVVIFYLFFHNRSDFIVLCWGGFGGIFLDILTNNPLYFTRHWPILKQLRTLHEIVHFDLPPKKWYWGALTSIIVIGGSLWYLLKF